MVSTLRLSGAGTRVLLMLLTFTAGLAAEHASAAQLTASWIDNSNGEATTRLERRRSTEVAFAVVADVPPGVTVYVDASVSAGTTYCYRALAYDAGGTSPYSAEACATPAAIGSDLSVTVAKTGSGAGTVTSTPPGILCGTSCSATFTSGSVTLVATPAAGSTFTGWSGGGCAGSASCTLAGNGALSVTATFTATSQTFVDVPASHPFIAWIEALVDAGITGGCATNPPRYCPDSGVTRGQMAVLLLRGLHGPEYQPPLATGMFADVAADDPLAGWIEQLAREGMTTGCGASTLYCPDVAVTREQVAVFLLRARHGTSYQPPLATGMFADVPPGDPFARWIEQLTREGITAGCSTSPARYCPDATMTRAQAAVFLVRTLNLPM